MATVIMLGLMDIKPWYLSKISPYLKLGIEFVRKKFVRMNWVMIKWSTIQLHFS